MWEGILWILRSGARWQDLPEKYPHPSTCWRRVRDWEEQGGWLNIWRAFLGELNERQQLKWSESFLGGSFAPAKKGAPESEKPSGERQRSGWWWSTARVFLWETTFILHPPAEVRLAETTLAAIRVGRRHCARRPRQKPVPVIADIAYDSDPLRNRLRRRGIVERTIGWLGNYRRLVVRYDCSLRIYRAFFHIACFMIALRRVVH